MAGVVDYIVGVIVLLVPVFIGLFYAYRDANKANREEYLLGGRSMSLIPVSVSMFVTFQSAISLIGVPSETITYGSMNVMLYIGYSLSFVIGSIAMVPLMYPLRITSIFEYIQLRYDSSNVRLMCTYTGIIYNMLYMAFALFAPALALEATIDLPFWLSLMVFGSVGTMYTALGGIKSVIWTDTFQTVIVLIGILAMLIAGIVEVGSVSKIWELSSEGGRLDFGVTAIDPRVRDTYIGAVVGGMIMYLTVPFSQSAMQRISSLETLQMANLTYLLNIPMTLCYGILLVTMGNVVYAYFAYKHCDPKTAGLITNNNQICPYFVMETLGHIPGIMGLYVSTLCCGALSTLSSGINALAANTVEDILAKPLASLKENTVICITKIIVVIYGVLIMVLAFFAKHLGGPVSQITLMVTGAFGTPLNVVFLMGGMVPWANKFGAVGGFFGGLAFTLWINFGRYFYGRAHDTLEPIPSDQCFAMSNSSLLLSNNSTTSQTLLGATSSNSTGQDYGFFIDDISFQWDSIFGTAVSFIVGLLISYFTRSLPNSGVTTDQRLIIPVFRRFWNMPPIAPTYSESIEDCEKETMLRI